MAGVLLLFTAACFGRGYDTPFVLRITDLTGSRVCYERVRGGQPAMKDGCWSRSDIVDLPESVEVGQCFEAREYHPLMRYTRSVACEATAG